MVASKLRKARKKHSGSLLYNLVFELFVRAYTRPVIRRIIGLFSAKKKEISRTAFLVGCYNSGTTVVRDIIKSHPEVGGMPREGVRFTDAFSDMQKNGWVRMAYHNRELPASFYENNTVRQKLACDWGFWKKSGETVFLEKSITHSFRLPYLKTIFPDAKFVAITRDGYCSSEGVLRRARPEGDAKVILGAESYPLSLCAQQWSYINAQIAEFSSDNPDCYHFRFEDFVEDPERIIRDIFEHVGVDASIVSFDGGQLWVGKTCFPIKNTNPASRERFISAHHSLEDFDAHAEAMMKRFGYDMVTR